MINPVKKLYRVILTDTTTMESEVFEEYDDKNIADRLAMKLKDEYWHKDKWVSVDEIEVTPSVA